RRARDSRALPAQTPGQAQLPRGPMHVIGLSSCSATMRWPAVTPLHGKAAGEAALSPPQSACGVDPFHAVFFCAAGAFRMKAHGLRKKPLPAVFSIANPVPARTRSRESSNCALDSRPALRGRVERLN